MTALTTDRRRPPARPVWEEPPGVFGQLGKGTVLAIIGVVVVVPLYVVLITSLSSQKAIDSAGGLVIVPRGLSIRAYREILSGGVVTRALLVSVGITAVGTAISVILTLLAAYGLSRPGSYAHRTLLMIVLLTFLFGPGLIPSYLVVLHLGLLNSYWSLILPTAISAFNLVVLRAFFMNIPRELLESARIDGAGELRILTSIALPLSKAVVAVVALFAGVGYWNAFFNALLYINDNSKWPLQLVLRAYVLQGQAIPGTTGVDTSSLGSGPIPTLAIKMAVVAIATIPVLLVYPFVQRHFTKGVIIGAIKG